MTVFDALCSILDPPLTVTVTASLVHVTFNLHFHQKYQYLHQMCILVVLFWSHPRLAFKASATGNYSGTFNFHVRQKGCHTWSIAIFLKHITESHRTVYKWERCLPSILSWFWPTISHHPTAHHTTSLKTIEYSIHSSPAASINALSILIPILCTQYIMVLKWIAYEL